jgi:plasmid stabilization system protein ParE
MTTEVEGLREPRTETGRRLLTGIEEDLDEQQDGTAEERAEVAFRERILAIEDEAAALAATPSGGSLDVERLDAAIARFYGRSLPYSTAEGIAREYEEGMDRARLNAPDAATPSEEATGLDVDVLARALAHDADAEPDEPVRLWDILSDRRRDDYRELAHRIAAEYARLTEDAG